MLLTSSRIALAQINCVLGDVKANIEHHIEFIERARNEGASAVVFPELSLTGYTLRDLNFEVALNPNSSPLLNDLRKLSKEVTIICGGVEEDDRGAVYNSGFLFEDGELAHVHRKVYLPTYGIFEENRYFSRGKDLEAFTSKRLGRIGILVCEDLWHPALPYLLAHDGAQCIVTIAASPTRLDTGEDAFQSLEPQNYTLNREHHSAYSRLLGLYSIFVNRVGVEDGVNFWGGSEIVTPSGEVCIRSKYFEEDLQIAQMEPAYVRQSRRLSRHFLDDELSLTQKFLEKVQSRQKVGYPKDRKP